MVLVFEGSGERLTREHKVAAWAIWHAASLNAYAYHKPAAMPSLESLTGEKRATRVQSPEEMKAVFAAMRARAKTRPEA